MGKVRTFRPPPIAISDGDDSGASDSTLPTGGADSSAPGHHQLPPARAPLILPDNVIIGGGSSGGGGGGGAEHKIGGAGSGIGIGIGIGSAAPSLAPPAGSGGTSGSVSRGRRRPTEISIPGGQARPFSLSESGTFREGDIQIGQEGLRVDVKGRGGAPIPDGKGSLGALAAPSATGVNQAASRETAMSISESDAGGGVEDNSNEEDADVTSSPASSISDGVCLRNGTGETPGGEGNGGKVSVSLDDLTVLHPIGNGSQGVVQKVKHEKSGTILALKEIPISMEERTRKQTLEELRTLAQSYNPYIVSCYGGFYCEGKVSIVLEYMDGGSLADISRAMGRIEDRYVGAMARMILEGLAYLHDDLRVIHRDIKPSNLLVSQHGVVKIADLGVAGRVDNSMGMCQSWCGTVTYMSPERINGRSYSFKSDVWSVGLTLLEMASGRFPYPPEPTPAAPHPPPKPQTLSFWDLLHFIVEHPPPIPKKGDCNGTSDELYDFLQLLLNKNPAERPSAREALNHPFVQKVDLANMDLSGIVKEAVQCRMQSSF